MVKFVMEMVYLDVRYSVLWGFVGQQGQCWLFTTIGP